jgi:hypothetical protein
MDKGQTLTQVFRTKSAKQTEALGDALGAMMQEIYEHKKTLDHGLYTDPHSGHPVMLVGIEGEPSVGKSVLSKGMAGGAAFWNDVQERSILTHIYRNVTVWQSCTTEKQHNRVIDGLVIEPYDTYANRINYDLPRRARAGIDFLEHADHIKYSGLHAVPPDLAVRIEMREALFKNRRAISLALLSPDAAESEIFQRHVNAPALAAFHG